MAVVEVPSLLVTAANWPTTNLSAVDGCLSMVTVVAEPIEKVFDPSLRVSTVIELVLTAEIRPIAPCGPTSGRWPFCANAGTNNASANVKTPTIPKMCRFCIPVPLFLWIQAADTAAALLRILF